MTQVCSLRDTHVKEGYGKDLRNTERFNSLCRECNFEICNVHLSKCIISFCLIVINVKSLITNIMFVQIIIASSLSYKYLIFGFMERLCNWWLCMRWSGWGESGQVPDVSTQTHRCEGWKLDWDIYNHGAGPFISVVRDLFWLQVYFKRHFMWIRVEMLFCTFHVCSIIWSHTSFHPLTYWGHLWHHERPSPRQQQWIPNRVIDSSASTSLAIESHTWLVTLTWKCYFKD